MTTDNTDVQSISKAILDIKEREITHKRDNDDDDEELYDDAVNDDTEVQYGTL